jgi:hypothetical protein
VFDQPTTWPAVRPMCAISRVVVVLPFVPVTATTGTRGRASVGVRPAGAARTRAAAATTDSSTRAPGDARSSSTAATASPRAVARPSRRQG